MNVSTPLFAAIVFLACTMCIIGAIYYASRNQSPSPPLSSPAVREPPVLNVTTILEQEFEYARSTANEAMQDRHKMVNFYLIAVGVAVTGSLALLRDGVRLPSTTDISPVAGTMVLWALCGVGWIYFLSLIRLRQAWCESIQAMNQIKTFYQEHAEALQPAELLRAFRWHEHTRPRANKPWTVFFYSAMLIALLNSCAFLGGGALLALDVSVSGVVAFWPTFWILLSLAIVYFLFHRLMYGAFLSEPVPND